MLFCMSSKDSLYTLRLQAHKRMLQNDKASISFRSSSVMCTDLKPMRTYSHEAVLETKP